MQYEVVKDAEEVIKGISGKDNWGNDVVRLTTSQIRKFLSGVNVVKNKVDVYLTTAEDKTVLSEELADEIKFLKVNIMYQAGREKNVKTFMKKARLDEIIDDIGTSTAEFSKFCKYIEALVAFHKFYGGKDK